MRIVFRKNALMAVTYPQQQERLEMIVGSFEMGHLELRNEDGRRIACFNEVIDCWEVPTPTGLWRFSGFEVMP